jgi:hypothetical protein
MRTGGGGGDDSTSGGNFFFIFLFASNSPLSKSTSPKPPKLGLHPPTSCFILCFSFFFDFDTTDVPVNPAAANDTNFLGFGGA